MNGRGTIRAAISPLRVSLEDLTEQLQDRVKAVTVAIERLQIAIAEETKIKSKGKQPGRRR
jgi:hypothetical protein